MLAINLLSYNLIVEQGGHTFPRQFSVTRRTITPVLSFDEKTTKIILNRCKSHGVSISSALFALCNIAWSKTSNQTPEMPMYAFILEIKNLHLD